MITKDIQKDLIELELLTAALLGLNKELEKRLAEIKPKSKGDEK